MATASLPAPSTTHPLRNPKFGRLWLGSTISVLGDQFHLVALPWVVLQLTGSGVAMGTVLMAAAIPRALLMLMGGAVSDRISPRKVMMVTAAARALLVAAIGALLWSNHLHLWAIYFLSFAYGVADAFDEPAAETYLPSLVSPQQLPAANSVLASTTQLATIVGPTPAAYLMKLLGAAWAFFIDAISFLFILAALSGLPDPPRNPVAGPRRGMLHSIAEGLKYVNSDVALRSLMILAAVLNFCMTGPFTVGLAYLAKKDYSSPTAFAIWMSAVAGGSLLGMVLAGARKFAHRGQLLLASSAVLGLGTACVGLVTHFWARAALLLLMGLTAGFVNIHLQSWYQQRVDRAMLGRVMSVLMLSVFGLLPVSLAVAGVLVEWNAKLMFVIAGSAVLLVTALAAVHRPVREIQ